MARPSGMVAALQRLIRFMLPRVGAGLAGPALKRSTPVSSREPVDRAVDREVLPV